MDYLTSRGINEDIARGWRLGVVPEGEPFGGRLAIPYRTPAGPSAIVFRTMRGEEPKYTQEPGVRRGIFNVHALHMDTDTMVVCEGEIDAISVHSLARVPAVAVPGAQAWRPHFAYCFEGYADVIVAADGDKAGGELARTVMKEVKQARVVSMPDGMDCNDVIRVKGADVFRKMIEVAE